MGVQAGACIYLTVEAISIYDILSSNTGIFWKGLRDSVGWATPASAGLPWRDGALPGLRFRVLCRP